MTIREATDADRLKGTAGYAQFKLVSVENEKITGCVGCSVFGRDPYLHDLEYWGDDPNGGPLLLRRGIRWCSDQARRLGQTHYFCNVSKTAPNVFDMCRKRGEVHQVVFKMEAK